MDFSLFGRGLILGFTIAATVGPISLLTIRRTLAHGRIYGLASGLGVALADATYGAIAAFGLTAISSLLVSGRVALGLLGGAFLVLLGWRTMTSRPSEAASVADRPGLARGVPLDLRADDDEPDDDPLVRGAVRGVRRGGRGGADAALIVAGVFCGSAGWWLVLTSVVAALRTRVTLRGLAWVNRISGAVVVGFGVAAGFAGALLVAVEPPA